MPFENKKAPLADARAHNMRLAREAGRYILRHVSPSMRLLDPASAAVRAACGVVRPAFGESRPWSSLVPLYLTQLELAIAGRAPGACGPAASVDLARAA
jgi:hypothetical protein